MKKLLLILIITVQYSLTGFTQDSVNCYIQVQDIWELDLNKSTVKTDFFLTLEYNSIDNIAFNLLNGTILSLDTIVHNSVEKYFTCRIIAEIRTNFIYDKFPIDNQIIKIKIEPFQYSDELVFFSRPEQNIYVGNIHLNGWDKGEIQFVSTTNNYEIFELNGKMEYNYSLAQFNVSIIRQNKISLFIKSYLPGLISILIIYIGFMLSPDQIDLRVNLSVGSLFVMISNFIVTQRFMPSVSTFTLMEKINISGLITIFLTILFFTLIYKLRDRISSKNHRAVNLLFATLITTCYLLSLVFAVMR